MGYKIVEILAKLIIPKMRCLIFQRFLRVTPTYVGLNPGRPETAVYVKVVTPTYVGLNLYI